MEYRRFGHANLEVSAIGFGTWPIGGARYGDSDEQEALRAVHAALDCGITCFDTAPSYGNGRAEALLGRALAGRRADVTIVSKGGLVWDDGSHVLGRDSSRARLERSLDDSLRRLRTDYLDLYLIHWPDPGIPLTEAMATLEDLARTGKTRQIGVSNFNQAQLRESASALRDRPLVANQVAFSLFERRWQRDVFATCAEFGVGVMAYGPLAHGLLSGAFSAATRFDASDWRSSGVIFGQPLLTPGNFERNLAVVERLRLLANRLGRTLPQLALAWVLASPAVTTALVGARTADEIVDAAGAAAVALPADVLAEIDAIVAGVAGMTDALPV